MAEKQAGFKMQLLTIKSTIKWVLKCDVILMYSENYNNIGLNVNIYKKSRTKTRIMHCAEDVQEERNLLWSDNDFLCERRRATATKYLLI